MHFRKAIIAVALLVEAARARDIRGSAAPGVYIIHEDSSSALGYHHRQGISIISNIPVTVQLYNDDQFMYGEQPVSANEAKVLITSDCDATTYVPQVSWGDSSVEVTVDGVLDPNYMPFLPASSYNASWSYTSFWCESMKHFTYPPTPAPASGEAAARLEVKGGGAFSLKSALRRALRRKPKAPEDEEDVESSNVCTVNVEVMLNGCEHGANVTAPKVRVVDGAPTNLQSGTNPSNECVTDYEADIVFPGPPTMQGSGALEVPRLDEEDNMVCSRAIEGRPFVDATGSTLQAYPMVVPTLVGEVKVWSGAGEDLMAEPRPAFDNRTVHPNQLALGEAWTTSALGEHASVASFAAFAIALMTNGAPADLVKDALEAALDEVRHAQTSFDIASRLLGREVAPGPLPASKHEFGQDLKALALAVAREGCVDETLSALEAAAKVDTIDAVLANGADEGSKYSGIDGEILARMRDELHTIAMEESNHAALAWRTLRWVCGADSEACNVVRQSVLSEEKLDGALRRRFGSVDGVVAESWRKIYSYDDVGARVCMNSGVGPDAEGPTEAASLVSIVATHVLHGISCS